MGAHSNPDPGPRRLKGGPGLLIRTGLVLVVLVTILGLALHSLSDRDIWFHWAAGQDLLDGSLVATNHYSYTNPDRPWVNHEWLFQVLITLTGKIAGGDGTSPEGLSGAWNGLRVALALLLGWTITRPLWRRSDAATGAVFLVWAGAGILLASVLVWTRLILRPEMLSFVLLAWLVPALEQVFREGRPTGPIQWLDPRRPCGRILWLTLLWAQIHGFAAMAPLLVIAAALLRPLQRRGSPGPEVPAAWASWGLLLVLSLLMLTATPSGWRGLIYPLQALGQFSGGETDLRDTILELVPLGRSPNSLGWTILLFKLSLVWSGLWILLRWPRVSLLRVVLLLGAAFAAWTNQRNLGLYAVALALLHHDPLPDASPTLAGRIGGRLPAAPLAWLPPALIVALAPLLWWSAAGDGFYLHEGVARRFGGGMTPAQQPIEAAEVLADEPEPRLFTNVDAAGFLLGMTGSRVFIDGRTEAYPADHWTRYVEVRAAGPAALRRLEESRPGSVCLALGGGAFRTLAADLLASPDWTLATAGSGGLLWRRSAGSDRDPQEILARAADRTLTLARSESRAARRADLALAAAYLQTLRGDQVGQRQALQEGLTARPDHPQVLHNLGNLEMESGANREAADLFDQALAANPRLAGSALNAGVCWLRMRDPGRAEQRFAQAAGIDPENFQAWANLAVARQALGDRPGALAAMTRAVELRPGDPVLRQRLQQMRR